MTPCVVRFDLAHPDGPCDCFYSRRPAVAYPAVPAPRSPGEDRDVPGQSTPRQ